MAKDYKELQKSFDYDKKKATVLAEALTELDEVAKRKKFLEELVQQHMDLAPFMWRTMEGKVIALHDIDDDHLKNILSYIVNKGRSVKEEIKAEARSRVSKCQIRTIKKSLPLVLVVHTKTKTKTLGRIRWLRTAT